MKQDILNTLSQHGQEHLLAFWDELNEAQRESLAAQIAAVDFDQIKRLFGHKDDQGGFAELAQNAGPPPAVRLDQSKNRFSADEAVAKGREAVAAGKLGVILVAGGQGTRLGFEHPKGMYPIGPVSGRSLFEIHVERILAAGKEHGVRDVKNRDFLLRDDSPCIDAGIVVEGLTGAFEGAAPDMGAYERGAEVWKAGHGWGEPPVF